MVVSTGEVMRHVGQELADQCGRYRELAFMEEAAGGLHAELRAAHLRAIADTYHGLETFLAGKLERMLEDSSG